MVEPATRSGAFISHIGAEAPIALVLQEYIRKAYPDGFPVFVSSDGRSIPGGEGWWQHIRDSLKGRNVVLALLSDESADRQWINFEAGIGDGAGATILLIAIKNYHFDKLGFPLKGFQGRYIDDLEGIFFDIDKATNRTASRVDKAAYLADIRRAEESVIYKSLILRPMRILEGTNPYLVFDLENRGNVDVDLLFAEVYYPPGIFAAQGFLQPKLPTLDVFPMANLMCARYYTTPASERTFLIPTLEETITKSMGARRLRGLRIGLRTDRDNPPLDLSAIIRYQIFGRNIDTEPEERTLAEIPVEPNPAGLP